MYPAFLLDEVYLVELVFEGMVDDLEGVALQAFQKTA
jgi:hypothetical protein